MDAWLTLVGAMVGLIGLWTVAHPNGGYRASGGAGSGIAPESRRAAGALLLTVGLVLLVIAGRAVLGG